jgi:hypothetical protein
MIEYETGMVLSPADMKAVSERMSRPLGTGLKRSRDVTLDVPPPHEDEPEEPEEVVRGVESNTLKTVEEETDDPISDPCSAARETVIEVETVTEEAATGPATDTAEATSPTEPEVPSPVKEAGGIHAGPYDFDTDEEDLQVEDTPEPAARPEERSSTTYHCPIR